MNSILFNKTILFVVSQLKVGGAAKMIKYVANLCADNFGHVTMVTYYDDYTPKDLNSSIIRINLGVESWGLPFWRVKALSRLKKVVKKGRYDIVCSFLPDVSAMSRLATIGTQSIIVSAERGDPFQFSKVWKAIVSWTYRRSDYCFFQLEQARDFFGEKVKKHSFVIPNPFVPGEGVSPYFGQRKKTIVSAGRFAKQKRFDILIQAFAKVHDAHPDYRLVLYGEGDCKVEYEELSKQSGIEDFIDYPGYVKNTAVHIREDGIFVLSSDYEGIPNSLIEAMSVGMPCVATDCSPGGASFLTDKGKRGLLIPVHEIGEMARAINQLIEDPDLSKCLSVKAIDITKELDIEVISKLWIDAFTQMIERRNGRKESKCNHPLL